MAMTQDYYRALALAGGMYALLVLATALAFWQ